MKRFLTWLIVLAISMGMVLVFSFTGCKGEEAPAEEVAEEEAPAEEAKVTIGIDVKTLDNAYFVNVLEGAQEECDKRGWELIDVQCANDPELQQSLMEDLVSKGVDVIVMLTSTDPVTSESVIASALDAGIPVVGLDSGVLGSVVTIYGVDNVPAGEQQAQYVIDTIGEEGNVCILEGIPGQSTAMDRTQGNMNIFERYPGITTTVRNANWAMEDGMTAMEDLLQQYDQIDAVTAGNDGMALGAVAAIETAGRLDEVLVVGWDGIDDAMDSIREGKLGGTVWVDSKELGVQGIVIAEKILNGEDFDYIERTYDWGTEKAILLQTIMVTQENINDYFPE